MRSTVWLLFVFASLFWAAGALYGQSTFKGDRLRDAVLEFVRSEMPDGYSVQVSKSVPDQRFPQSGLKARIVPLNLQRTSHVNVIVEFTDGETVHGKATIPVILRRIQVVPVLNRKIAAGESIGQSDIDLVERDVEPYGNATFVDEKTCPLIAKRMLNQGTVLVESMVHRGAVVKRGTYVSFASRRGPIVIAAKGQALNDAAPGEQVRIKRDGSPDIISCVVAADGTIVVR